MLNIDTEKPHGAKWASIRFRQLFEERHGRRIDFGSGRRAWQRHYIEIQQMKRTCGSLEAFVGLATWWFRLASRQSDLMVESPIGLHHALGQYEVWRQAHEEAINSQGLEGAINSALQGMLQDEAP